MRGFSASMRDDAHEIPVGGDGVHRPIERGQRVVSQEEPEARVVAGPALLVERAEPVEPERRALARAHADLEGEDLGRELALLLEVAQEGPEVGDRVRHRLGAAGVRLPAGKRLLEPAAGGGLPVPHALPEEPVEAPDHAVADGRPRLEGDSARRAVLERRPRRRRAPERAPRRARRARRGGGPRRARRGRGALRTGRPRAGRGPARGSSPCTGSSRGGPAGSAPGVARWPRRRPGRGASGRCRRPARRGCLAPGRPARCD